MGCTLSSGNGVRMSAPTLSFTDLATVEPHLVLAKPHICPFCTVLAISHQDRFVELIRDTHEAATRNRAS